MDTQQALTETQEALKSRPVFSEPVRLDGVTLVTATALRGGGGGGTRGERGGAGFRIQARPAGAFVVSAGKVRWRPAIDVNRVILGAQLVAATVVLTLGLLSAERHARRLRMGRWWR
jgi:hypothetical protein